MSQNTSLCPVLSSLVILRACITLYRSAIKEENRVRASLCDGSLRDQGAQSEPAKVTPIGRLGFCRTQAKKNCSRDCCLERARARVYLGTSDKGAFS